MIGFGESQNLIRDYFIFIVYVVGGIVYVYSFTRSSTEVVKEQLEKF